MDSNKRVECTDFEIEYLAYAVQEYLKSGCCTQPCPRCESDLSFGSDLRGSYIECKSSCGLFLICKTPELKFNPLLKAKIDVGENMNFVNVSDAKSAYLEAALEQYETEGQTSKKCIKCNSNLAFNVKESGYSIKCTSCDFIYTVRGI